MHATSEERSCPHQINNAPSWKGRKEDRDHVASLRVLVTILDYIGSMELVEQRCKCRFRACVYSEKINLEGHLGRHTKKQQMLEAA
jgi:hypothetical protein